MDESEISIMRQGLDEIKTTLNFTETELYTLFSVNLLSETLQDDIFNNLNNINYDKVIETCGCIELTSHALRKILIDHKPGNSDPTDTNRISEKEKEFLKELGGRKKDEGDLAIFNRLAYVSAQLKLSKEVTKKDSDFSLYIFKQNLD